MLSASNPCNSQGKQNMLKLNNLVMSYHGNKRNLKWHTARNNWRLKWFQLSLKRYSLDGCPEKP